MLRWRNPQTEARRPGPRALGCILFLLAVPGILAAAADPACGQDRRDRTQERTSLTRVAVPADSILVDDGDTVEIRWPDGDTEVVRILGIDTPETRHEPHNIPYDQPFGREARAFAQGAFALADSVELLRAEMKDPYGRTLGYLFLNGRNYSELVILAGLAVESVSRYGDNGFPGIAQDILDAARSVGPAPFENPGDFRRRMRDVSDWRKAHPERP